MAGPFHHLPLERADFPNEIIAVCGDDDVFKIPGASYYLSVRCIWSKANLLNCNRSLSGKSALEMLDALVKEKAIGPRH